MNEHKLGDSVAIQVNHVGMNSSSVLADVVEPRECPPTVTFEWFHARVFSVGECSQLGVHCKSS